MARTGQIFPNRIRGAAMSVAVTALWIACFILTYTFPMLNAKLGSSGTFWLYGAICVGGFALIFLELPETKGKTLEQLEKGLVDRPEPNDEACGPDNSGQADRSTKLVHSLKQLARRLAGHPAPGARHPSRPPSNCLRL